jgi:hypothetical protein
MTHSRILSLLLILPLLSFGCQKSIETASGSSSRPASSQTGNVPKLTTEKVQSAVDKALDWTRKGGRAVVLGIQELPQENAARADIRFEQFQYATDHYGQPISASKQAKPLPKDRLPSPDELFGQPKVVAYSGKGVGVLKHYPDGRWVLAEVHFNLVGVNSNIEIH